MELIKTRHLDPKKVRPSQWANRHESSFHSIDFIKLKIELSEARGNVQPIKVRAVQDGNFEIVFGHRRHRACLELGLPVLATLVELDDRGLWEEMARENRFRADLSPFEQGLQYKVALERGLYPSRRRLAHAIGVDVSQAAKVIRLAELPTEVIAAFGSPNDIQVNWAPALQTACERDLAGVVVRAKKIQEAGSSRPSPKSILAALVGGESVEPSHTQKVEIFDAARCKLAVITRSRTGYSIEITRSEVPLAKVEAALRTLLIA